MFACGLFRLSVGIFDVRVENEAKAGFSSYLATKFARHV